MLRTCSNQINFAYSWNVLDVADDTFISYANHMESDYRRINLKYDFFSTSVFFPSRLLTFQIEIWDSAILENEEVLFIYKANLFCREHYKTNT